MLSAKFDGAAQVRMIEVDPPRPGPGEVVVQTAVSAICGSELHAYRGAGVPSGNGGHEGVGTVVEVGPGVRRLRVGQRVGVSAIAGCGQCPSCRRGIYTWCPTSRFYGSMHAERYLASAIGCHVLPDDASWEEAVLLTGDGLGVPFHTSKRLKGCGVRTVTVFGLGPIGLGNVLVEAFLGRRVLAVDVSPYRIAYARDLGAAEAIDATAGDPVEQIRALTGGVGVDAAIEAAGRPETARQCFASVRRGGTVVFNGEQGPLALSPSDDFIRRDITALGLWYYHFRDYRAMLALWRDGLPLRRLISHRYPLREAPEAFREFAAGRTAKVLLQAQA